MASPKFHNTFRQYHRILGFFLSGIMLVYALSGVLLIFRGTDFLKFEHTEQITLETEMNAEDLGASLRIRRFNVEEENAQFIRFAQGEYNKVTGEAVVTKKEYPTVLAKMVKLHKATTNSPLYWLNVFFGLGLLFFVVSSFFMFMPRIPLFKKNMKIAVFGVIFAIVVVVIGS